MGEKAVGSQKKSNGAADKDRTSRLVVGGAIVTVGTVLGILMFPLMFDTYHWAAMLFALLMCYGYGSFLHMYDFSRMRAFMVNYMVGFGAMCLAPYVVVPILRGIADVAPKGSFGNVIGPIPILCALYAIVATHALGARPDIVIAKKTLSD